MIFALHGNVGSPTDFDFLSDLKSIEAINLWPYSHLTLSEVGAEIRQRAQAHQTRGILGYSMGGRIALQSIADAPDFWDFAIIISAHPGLTSETEKAKRIATDHQWAETIRTESWNDFLKKWNHQTVLTGPISPHQPLLEPDRFSIAAAFENWSLGQQKDLRPGLKTTTLPITWVVGQSDQKFQPIAEEIAQTQPNIDLINLPDCGHRVLLEAPEAIKSILEATT